jgi:hypothetical protein
VYSQKQLVKSVDKHCTSPALFKDIAPHTLLVAYMQIQEIGAAVVGTDVVGRAVVTTGVIVGVIVGSDVVVGTDVVGRVVTGVVGALVVVVGTGVTVGEAVVGITPLTTIEKLVS